MHRTIKITVMILLWIFVAAFVVVFDRRAARHRAETKVRALAVDIVDSLRDETLVSSDAVRRWIAGSKIATVGVPLAEVDLAGIEQAILRNGFVERANAYVTYDGELRVEVSQRRPLLRLLVDGYDCYVTADGFVFPAPRSASAFVPVVTGSYAPPVPPKYVGRVEDHIASRVAESEARIVEMQYEKVPLFQSDKAVEDSLRSVRRMRIKKGLFESHDHFDERVAALRREWLRLFVGAGTPDAPSWESFYRDPNSQLFSARTLEVREQYRRHGLQIERLHAEPDDHLGLMLGFVGHLIGLEAEALAVGDGAAAGEAADEQESFLVEHVLPWLAAWRYSVDAHASSDYFRGTGAFVFGLCARYAQRFGVAFDREGQVFKRK